MSKTKDSLKARQKELKDALANLKPLQDELAEVETALEALEPKKKYTCSGNPCIKGNGCDECRTGWAYR